MSNKTINLKDSVYEICEKNPEIIDILVELGFESIKVAAIRASMGKFVTIPKGATMKKISLDDIIARFEEKDYQVINK